jgi:uracil-DNA glycosylase
MTPIDLAPGADLAGFRQAVRFLVARRIPPGDVSWTSGQSSLPFGDPGFATAPSVVLPRKAASLVERVVCHRDPERYALLYQLVWRVVQGERALLEVESDLLVHRLLRMAKAVDRDLHKMQAFVRFRRVEDHCVERFIAWFEPDHFILEATAGFFVDRFRGMAWSILTPVGSLHWDKARLTLGPPGCRRDMPDGDGFEDGWLGYYAASFNPARVNPDAMKAEMPRKYWHNMPESRVIPELVRHADTRATEMVAKAPTVPIKRDPAKAVEAMTRQAPASLAELNRAIMASEPMVEGGTKAVLGEGPQHPALAFVGEQPGDQEDVAGRPFVGPAGQLLTRAMEEAGIARAASYLTNAVKHFKFVQRGKRRLHQTPTVSEVGHYRWWLEKELEFVRPRIVVALGATAVLALTGKRMPVTSHRGETRLGAFPGFITVHPSYVLRLPGEEAQRRAYAELVEDLRHAAACAGALASQLRLGNTA